MLSLAATISLLCGCYYGNHAKYHPDKFWTYLLIGLIFTTPFAIGGYTWYDEIFIFGYLISNIPGEIKIKLKPSHIIFSIFSLYMVIEGIRGVIFFSNYGFDAAVHKIRWIVFFIIIFLIFIKSISAKISNNIDINLPYKITVAGLLFSLIYILFGLIAIYTGGSTGFTQYAQLSDTHGKNISHLIALFGSTAYVTCIYFIIIPAALIVIKNDNSKNRNVAWLCLAVVIATQILYNSRSGMIIVFIFLALYFIQNFYSSRTVKGFIVFVPLLAMAILFQVYFNENRVGTIIEDLANTLGLGDPTRYNPDLQDIDRRVWNYGAIIALLDNTFNFIFGWGLRTSGYIIAPYVYDLFMAARGKAKYINDVATPAFSGLAIDTGALGLLLIFALWVYSMLTIYRRNRRMELFMLLMPTAFILQLFVINIFDVVLLYLALMPFGICYVLTTNKNKDNKNICVN